MWGPYFLLSASKDGSVRLWHPSREGCLFRFLHPDGTPVTAIAAFPSPALPQGMGGSRGVLSPPPTLPESAGLGGGAGQQQGACFLTGCADMRLRVWNMDTGKVVLWQAVPSAITCAAISPDGALVLAGLASGAVAVFASDTLRFLRELSVWPAERNGVGGGVLSAGTLAGASPAAPPGMASIPPSASTLATPHGFALTPSAPGAPMLPPPPTFSHRLHFGAAAHRSEILGFDFSPPTHCAAASTAAAATLPLPPPPTVLITALSGAIFQVSLRTFAVLRILLPPTAMLSPLPAPTAAPMASVASFDATGQRVACVSVGGQGVTVWQLAGAGVGGGAVQRASVGDLLLCCGGRGGTATASGAASGTASGAASGAASGTAAAPSLELGDEKGRRPPRLIRASETFALSDGLQVDAQGGGSEPSLFSAHAAMSAAASRLAAATAALIPTSLSTSLAACLPSSAASNPRASTPAASATISSTSSTRRPPFPCLAFPPSAALLHARPPHARAHTTHPSLILHTMAEAVLGCARAVRLGEPGLLRRRLARVGATEAEAAAAERRWEGEEGEGDLWHQSPTHSELCSSAFACLAAALEHGAAAAAAAAAAVVVVVAGGAAGECSTNAVLLASDTLQSSTPASSASTAAAAATPADAAHSPAALLDFTLLTHLAYALAVDAAPLPRGCSSGSAWKGLRECAQAYLVEEGKRARALARSRGTRKSGGRARHGESGSAGGETARDLQQQQQPSAGSAVGGDLVGGLGSAAESALDASLQAPPLPLKQQQQQQQQQVISSASLTAQQGLALARVLQAQGRLGALRQWIKAASFLVMGQGSVFAAGPGDGTGISGAPGEGVGGAPFVLCVADTAGVLRVFEMAQK